MTPQQEILAIIPCMGHSNETRRCIRSLLNQGFPENSILLVENETHENKDNLLSQFPQIRYLRNEQNVGFGAAVNRGFEAGLQSGEKYFLLINNDAILEEQCVRRLMLALAENPQAGFAVPMIFSNADKTRIWAAGGEWFPWKCMARNRGMGQKDSGLFFQREKLEFLPGCVILIRKEVLSTSGAFDEEYFMYAEDVDFCLRARSKGWELLFEPAAQAVHPGSLTSGGQYEPFQSFYRWRNRLLLRSKHGTLLQKLFFYFIFFPPLALRDLLVYAKKGRFRTVPTLFKGLFQFIQLKFGFKVEPLRIIRVASKRWEGKYLLSNPLAVLIFSALDLAGAVWKALLPSKKFPENIRKIVIAKMDHLGDAVLALHFLPSIHKAFPGAAIDWVCGSWALPVLRGHPQIRKIFTYDDFRLSRQGTKFEKIMKCLKDLIRIIPSLRSEKYDLAVDLRSYYPNFAPVFALSGARFRLGFATGGLGFFFDKTAEWRDSVHETEHFMDLLRVVFPEAERIPADFDYLSDKSSSEKKPYVVIHPFCQKSFLKDQKHWSSSEWKKLIRFFEDQGVSVIGSGDSHDSPHIEKLFAETKARNLAGKTTLGNLSSLIQGSALTVCVDTFFAHLSGALGAQTFELFNDVEPVAQWKAWGEKVQTFPIESSAEDLIPAIQGVLNP